MTSRQSPRCAGSNHTPERIPDHGVVDCPVCGRPMDASGGRIRSHGTERTRGTEAADSRLAGRRQAAEAVR